MTFCVHSLIPEVGLPTAFPIGLVSQLAKKNFLFGLHCTERQKVIQAVSHQLCALRGNGPNNKVSFSGSKVGRGINTLRRRA